MVFSLRVALGDTAYILGTPRCDAFRRPPDNSLSTVAIERVHGCHVFPDAVVASGAEDPKWLYTVTFEGATLWGEDSEPGLRISVDAFEPYLDAA